MLRHNFRPTRRLRPQTQSVTLESAQWQQMPYINARFVDSTVSELCDTDARANNRSRLLHEMDHGSALFSV